MTSTLDPSALPSAAGDPEETGRRLLKRRPNETLPLFFARIALPLLLVLLIAIFSAVRPETFATVDNLKTVLNLQAVLTILAIGLLLPLIVGELDLSVAANLGLGLILVTGLTSQQGMPATAAMVIAVAACTAVGFINGLLVSKVGINSFIVTIGMSTILTGLIGAYTLGNVFYENIPEELTQLGQGNLLGIPLPVVIAAAIGLIVWYLLSQTPAGRFLYAIGGSRDAARLSGIAVPQLTVAAFAGAGALAGIAGIVQAGILGSGSPTVGPPMLLPAYAAVFLGATAFLPGTFNVWGTIIAVITLQVGTTGLALIGAPFWIEPLFTGTALIAAVAATRFLRGEAT
ncbi:ABC transporter permease [Arthrobacter sp. 4R501]|uniref:ABC transporter permease n=1 Tax=Arthrobacter sp. 4R501 TaxID=2058886 RepID=UPI000CE53B03|nr:ABC transporter permease [Arthrobacter sp. 4R501]